MDVRVGSYGRLSVEELILSSCGAGKDSWESLNSKEMKLVCPKGGEQWIFIGRTDAEAEASIHWSFDVKSWLGKDPDAGKDWGQEERVLTEDEMVGWCHWLNGHEVEQSLGDSKDREAWPAVVHGVTKSQTGFSDWKTNYVIVFTLFLLGPC